MQFLRTLLVALTVGLAVAFSINNWGTHVPIQLWGGLIAEVKLPFLLLVTLLAGLLPMWVAYRAVLWRSRQRTAANERIIADLRAAAAAAPVAPLSAGDLPPRTDAPPLLQEPAA
jgi:lipopolysaccharide assembly protein A